MYSSIASIILSNSETKPHEKTSKEKYEEKERIREEKLSVYFEKIRSEFKPGDVLYFDKKRCNDTDLGLLYKEMYLQRECGELFIKIPFIRIEKYIQNAVVSGCGTVQHIFEPDDYEIRLATSEEIVSYIKNYLKEEIDDRKEVILNTKEEMRILKHTYNCINEKFTEDTIKKISSEIVG